jgi:hypothetical protein
MVAETRKKNNNTQNKITNRQPTLKTRKQNYKMAMLFPEFGEIVEKHMWVKSCL